MSGSNQVSRNPYSDYYIRDYFEAAINQLEATAAIAPFTQTTNSIPTWVTSATGPSSDHNALNNTTVLLDQNANISQVNTLSFLYGATGNTGATGTIWVNNNGVLMNGNSLVTGNGATGSTGATGSSGSGNVNGAASSTNMAIARFNGTGGKTIENSDVTIDNTGNMTFNTQYTSINMIGPTGPTSMLSPIQGTGVFGSCLSVGMNNGNIIPSNFDTSTYFNNVLVGYGNYNTVTPSVSPDYYAENVIIGCSNAIDVRTPDFYLNTIVGNSNLQATIIDGGNSTTDNVIIGSNNVILTTSNLNTTVIVGNNNFTTAESGYISDDIIIGNGCCQNTVGDHSGNIIIGSGAGNNLTDNCNSNVGVGYNCFGNGSITSSNSINSNVGVGDRAAFSLTDGAQWNTLIGTESGYSLGGVTGNVAIGGCLGSCQGNTNTIVGYRTMSCTGTVNQCTAIGRVNNLGSTGGTYTNNVYIDPNIEIGPETNTIRIGNSGHTKLFTQGIRGITTGQSNAINVLVDSNGQLGTVSSSAKYKRNIKDIDHNNVDVILNRLRPVKFNAINCDGVTQEKESIGLVAEEVERVYPDMCIYENDGSLLTVDYNRVIILLLAQVQTLYKELREFKTKVEMGALIPRSPSKSVFSP